jgi:hypothetical protein
VQLGQFAGQIDWMDNGYQVLRTGGADIAPLAFPQASVFE